jgi:hypothetical protein
MARRKIKAAGWYKQCLKQLPKKNCDALRAIAARKGTHARFRGLGSMPDEHARMAEGHRDRTNEAEGRAMAAYRRGDCREAYDWGLRAITSAKAAIEHANESGNRTLVERIRQSNSAAETFVTKLLPTCLKKKLAPL